MSPTLISFLEISSSLWSVTFETSTPPTFTGFNLPTGVRAPVLPTCVSIFKSIVSTISGGSL